MFKLMRRGSARVAVVSVIFLTILACIYYTNYTNSVGPTQSSGSKGSDESLSLKLVEVKPRETVSDSVLRRISIREWIEQDSSINPNVCPLLWSAQTDVDTVARFKTFDFQPYWMKSKEYWDTHFEERYKERKEKWSKLPLKVILVPHSHNDPGWLKTYESYFHYHSRNILNNMAEKLKVLPNMTFIWSEISFFAQWWESAHPNKKHTVKKLLDEGRLEITTGGWVMTDEATTHIYGMLDQLIEGPNEVSCECVYSGSETDSENKTENKGIAKSKKSTFRQPFTAEEDRAILDYLAENKRYTLTGGNVVWKEAEKENICPGRSFWSLKERFRKHIILNLHTYKLDNDFKKKLVSRKDIEQGNQKDLSTEQEFSNREDASIVKYFLENIQDFATDGLKAWKLAEDKQICPGKTFWSMRERFLKFIVPNIESYKCDERIKNRVKKIASDLHDQISGTRGNYVFEEDMAIIKFVTQGDRYLSAKGIKIWKDAERDEICPGRTYWSMNERFKKIILPNLDRYNLDEEQREKLDFLTKASTDEIAFKRVGLLQKNPRRKNISDSVVHGDSDSDSSGAGDAMNLRSSGRFKYPPLEQQRVVESPMGRLSETPSLEKLSSAKKSKSANHREASPQPTCSKYFLSDKKTKNLDKRKAANSGLHGAEEMSPKKKAKKNDSPAKDTDSEDDVSDKSEDSTPPTQSRSSNRKKSMSTTPQKTNNDFSCKKSQGDKSPVVNKDDNRSKSPKSISNKSPESSPNKQTKNLGQQRVVDNSPKKTNKSSPKRRAKRDKSPVEATDSADNEPTLRSPAKEDFKTKARGGKAKGKETTLTKKSEKADSLDYETARATDTDYESCEDSPENTLQELSQSRNSSQSVNNSPKKGNKSPPKKKFEGGKSPVKILFLDEDDDQEEKSPENKVSKVDLSPSKQTEGKKRAVNNSPKKTNGNSSRKKGKRSRSPVEVVDSEEQPSETAVKVSPRTRSRHPIIPFFEEMKKDEKNNKVVASTPKKSPVKTVLNNVKRTSPRKNQSANNKKSNAVAEAKAVLNKLKRTKRKINC